MHKKTLCLLLASLIIFGAVNILSVNKYGNAYAQAEIAMELSTETVLTENNSSAKLPMASTTKILTAIIIIEDCNIEDAVVVPDEAVGIEGSSIYLKKQEQISIKDLLYGLMLRSGNDSAVALALLHSGSIEKFAEAMNDKAKSIGALSSHFTNPSGLPDSEHYTTAYDLCKIACYAMKNEVFKEIVSTTEYKGDFRSFTNKNKMLRIYEGANGIKTGYTVKAGRCLVSSAEREGMDIVCVVLNCPDMYERSISIFDSCFNNYKLLNIDSNKVFICNKVLCKLKNSVNILVKSNSTIEYKTITLNKDPDGAVAKLEIYDENSLIFTEKLYSIIDS